MKSPFDIYRICEIKNLKDQNKHLEKIELNRKCYQSYLALSEQDKKQYRIVFSKFQRQFPLQIPNTPINSPNYEGPHPPEILSFKRYFRKYIAKNYDNNFFSKLKFPERASIREQYLKYRAIKQAEIENFEIGGYNDSKRKGLNNEEPGSDWIIDNRLINSNKDRPRKTGLIQSFFKNKQTSNLHKN